MLSLFVFYANSRYLCLYCLIVWRQRKNSRRGGGSKSNKGTRGKGGKDVFIFGGSKDTTPLGVHLKSTKFRFVRIGFFEAWGGGQRQQQKQQGVLHIAPTSGLPNLASPWVRERRGGYGLLSTCESLFNNSPGHAAKFHTRHSEKNKPDEAEP